MKPIQMYTSSDPPRIIASRYENYFRIDYTIAQSLCRPQHMFNSIKTMESIRSLVKNC